MKDAQASSLELAKGLFEKESKFDPLPHVDQFCQAFLLFQHAFVHRSSEGCSQIHVLPWR